MKDGQSSRTAEAAAALRANHFQNAENPVFADPFAFELTSKGWQKLLTTTPTVKMMNSPVFNRTLGLLTGQVVGRSRYAEDQLYAAIDRGVQQYVLVGAGLDSFILRQAQYYPALKIFEVDHPDTQTAKQKKLKEFGDIPTNVEFVAIDFEKESIADALTRSSFQQEQAAFFSWLGTTHYLEPQTTLNTLASIAIIAAEGSEVVLDYSIDYRQLQGIERLGSLFVSQFTGFLKEPLRGQFRTKTLHQAVEKMGYDVVEDLSGDGLSERYFHNRPDRIRHTIATHMLHLRLQQT
ncbi:class I SAM-dependent methyltransferase [Acinetobacter sp. NIPH 1852]|uniref:class I SAM-dependent methyltransferase n=1 Tax=Acinetobacter sp. NIPH 1852 TaxID=2923428 RepID=UPI001B507550|nr:class I SAM-dependent methyltransferase [Acinetobacter sp. NIPH 1852]MBP7880784.1 class I SAM-dependent methyltransferase [Acinetobacter sp.]MCH7307246.1 class I SAM-dependent methyltransferase [Acinetobacter sp. NIPH 1852]